MSSATNQEGVLKRMLDQAEQEAYLDKISTVLLRGRDQGNKRRRDDESDSEDDRRDRRRPRDRDRNNSYRNRDRDYSNNSYSTRSYNQNGGGAPLARNQCGICKEFGHWKDQCPKLALFLSQQQGAQAATTTTAMVCAPTNPPPAPPPPPPQPATVDPGIMAELSSIRALIASTKQPERRVSLASPVGAAAAGAVAGDAIEVEAADAGPDARRPYRIARLPRIKSDTHADEVSNNELMVRIDSMAGAMTAQLASSKASTDALDIARVEMEATITKLRAENQETLDCVNRKIDSVDDQLKATGAALREAGSMASSFKELRTAYSNNTTEVQQLVARLGVNRTNADTRFSTIEGSQKELKESQRELTSTMQELAAAISRIGAAVVPPVVAAAAAAAPATTTAPAAATTAPKGTPPPTKQRASPKKGAGSGNKAASPPVRTTANSSGARKK